MHLPLPERLGTVQYLRNNEPEWGQNVPLDPIDFYDLTRDLPLDPGDTPIPALAEPNKQSILRSLINWVFGKHRTHHAQGRND